MGRIYRLYYDYPKSLEAYRNASECYERAGKIRHRNYMWRYQSAVYRNMDKFNESERLLQIVLSSAQNEQDADLVKSCLGSLVMLLVEQNRMSEAKELYEKEMSPSVGEEYGSSSFMATLATLYASVGDFEKAECYLTQGWKRAMNHTDSISLYLSSSEVWDLSNNRNVAYQDLLKGVSLQNKETQQALQQPILTAQRDYLSEKVAFEAYRHRMEKHFRFLCIHFFIVLLGIVVYVLSKILKQEKEKARRTIDELNDEMQRKEAESNRKVASLLQELERKNQSDIIINSLREELSRRDENLKQYICESESIRRDLQHVANENLVNASQLFRERIELIGEMILSFEEKKDSNINEEIRWWKDKYLVGRKAIAELERQVNMYCQDAMSHFRKEVSMNEEADYHWVCYLFAGVSIKTIAWLMKENKGSVYQRRLRLRSEIESSECLHKELYLRLLGK